MPIFGSDPKRELEPRADCENCALQNTATPSETNTAPNSLTWRLIKCGVNPNLMNPYSGGPLMAPDAQTAWNSMSGTAQGRIQGIQGSGYYGAGYWTLNGNAWYALAVVDLPLGQAP